MSNSKIALDLVTAYRLLLANRNRAGMPPPAPLDEYWRSAIDAAVCEIESRGIVLTNSVDDLMLIADYATFKLDARDRGGAMPDWLRAALAHRWRTQHLREGAAE